MIFRALFVLFVGLALAGGEDKPDDVGQTCVKRGPELAAQCTAPGSERRLLATGAQECGLNGTMNLGAAADEAGGECKAEGRNRCHRHL